MSGYRADSQVGRVITGQVDTIWHPRTPRVGTCGLVLFHGQDNTKQFMDSTQLSVVNLVAALANAGIPCIAAEFNGNAWANDATMPAVPVAAGVLQAAYPQLRTDKVCVLGISHGAAFVARYSQLNPADVAAAVGLIPAYDPKAVYVANDAADTAMETAWGFTGLGQFPDALDLGPKADMATTVPLMSAYASNDSLIPVSSVTDYHTAAGGQPENLVNLGALGHTPAAIEALSISALARFLVANGA